MRRLFRYFHGSIRLAFAAGLGVLAFGQAAQAANPLEMNFWLSGPRYDGNVPPCEAALDEISSRFATKESRFWNSNLEITGYADVREVAFRPWASDTIPRRFCSAHAMLNDGHTRKCTTPSLRTAASPPTAPASRSASSAWTATGRIIRLVGRQDPNHMFLQLF